MDHDGEPIANRKGYIGVERTYNSDGKMESENWIPAEEGAME